MSRSRIFAFIRPIILRDDQFADLKFISARAIEEADLGRFAGRDAEAWDHETAAGWIRIRGATQHNLAGVDVDLPRGSLVAVTGVLAGLAPAWSGSRTQVVDALKAGAYDYLTKPLDAADLRARLRRAEGVWLTSLLALAGFGLFLALGGNPPLAAALVLALHLLAPAFKELEAELRRRLDRLAAVAQADLPVAFDW